MLKIDKLFRAANGTQEAFTLEWDSKDFEIPEVTGTVKAEGDLLRVKEGIMMLVKKLETTQETPCARCGTMLKFPLKFKPSEWLFYETEPLPDDDENEHLQLDVHRLEINPFEPIRQDLILNLDPTPHCKKPCATFKQSTGDEGIKALAGLKDLIG